MINTPKYKNYAELAAAFKSGELSSDHYALVLDKGGTENYLRYYNPDESEEVNDAKSDECSKLFNGDQSIESIFEAAGIPCEWC